MGKRAGTDRQEASGFIGVISLVSELEDCYSIEIEAGEMVPENFNSVGSYLYHGTETAGEIEMSYHDPVVFIFVSAGGAAGISVDAQKEKMAAAFAGRISFFSGPSAENWCCI